MGEVMFQLSLLAYGKVAANTWL